MCKEFGRSGTLYGQCDKERNYYPRAYSFDLSCFQCDGNMSSNLWKYIALAYLPLTVFYLIVFFLKKTSASIRSLCYLIVFQHHHTCNFLLVSRKITKIAKLTLLSIKMRI